MPTAYLYLIAAIVFETIGTSALQASQQFTRLLPSVVVVLAYAISFWLLAHSLKTIPVGIAYAIWSGLGIVLIAATGWTVFGQALDFAALIGLTLIIAGIVVIHFFSNAMHN